MVNLIFYVLLIAAIVYGDESSMASFTCTANPSNRANDRLEELINETRANTIAINQLKATLSDLKNTLCTTAKSDALFTSCKEIKQKMPLSPSGIYQIVATVNTTEYVYCNMETLCGSDEGWTRLAYINMTNSSESCPGGLRLLQANGKRACGRRTSGGGSCHSIKYPSHGVEYSRVCGKAIGYQWRSPDAINAGFGIGHKNNINSYYVDGISFTRGSPRQHVWTLMAGLKEGNAPGGFTCPCQIGSTQSTKIPSFVGNDYYCESGNPALPHGWKHVLYTADPLWDGKQCNGPESPCCVPGLPWFNKELGTTTSDYIEVRVCADQSTSDEEAFIEQLEIYVK